MEHFVLAPFREFYMYRELILYQIKAEFKQKHFQKALGPLWWFGEPVLQAFVFIFLTSFLFRQTFAEHHQMTIIMSVLIWRWFSRSVDSAPGLLLGFQFELKKTNLPVLPLVFTNMAVELMFFGFALIVIFAGLVIDGVTLTANVLFVPILVIIQMTMITGFVSFLAKYGVFFRDLGQIVWVGVAIWFYLSPGIYPENLIPDGYRWLYDMNPFATILPAWRQVLIEGTTPDLFKLGIWFLVFLPIALAGLRSVNNSRAEYFKRL
jgi:lipopolysaccharide transport system permease protein